MEDTIIDMRICFSILWKEMAQKRPHKKNWFFFTENVEI